MLFLSFLLQTLEAMRLAQMGLDTAATGLMLTGCRATSMCNTTTCLGIDDTSFGGQGEYDIENWRMVYWRPQKGQLANPKFAAFCDSWEATKAKYPYLQEQAQGVKDSLASVCSYKTTSDWSQEQPYARVCIPTKVGIKKGINPRSYIIRVNPFGSDTDATSTTFYKSFISDGQIWNSYCGAAMH
ncbi:hypothetical protein M9435_006813 [Picochlorum sp. BPE23]|nr:hypothetical protein M9435_006813 [Picochlorum sp. BPE23]